MADNRAADQAAPGDLRVLLKGLTQAEATRRLEAFGPNRLQPKRTRGTLQIARDAMREPMFLLLLAATGVYFVTGDLAEALFLLVSAMATIGLVIFQEARSERALAALRRLAEPQARVIRDGAARQVAASELVPGDILLTGEGERLPADGVLVAGEVLSVDESALTGESVPVAKQPDPTQASGGAEVRPGEAEGPWLFGGTLVVRGQGVARITRTGAASEIGRIGASLAGLDLEAAPLQKVTRRLVRQMGVLSILVSLTVLVLYGLLERDWARGALAGLTIGISLVPEEFPMVLAIFLALGAFRMARENVLARRGAAIETLGAMSILCVDKTGTLTENRMRIAALWRDGRTWNDGKGGAPGADFEPLLEAAALASAPEPVDPMDRAVREMAGARADGERRPLKAFPLTPQRLAFVQMWPETAGEVTLAAKGAPEAIARLCRLAPSQAARSGAAAETFAARGLRVLGVAWASATDGEIADPDEADFAFEGLIAFEDPVRTDVPPALEKARTAGVEVAMITGDYPATALEIAARAGIDTSGGVLSGTEIARMNADALVERVRRTRVFARVAPEQKLALVEAFRAAGAVVGMIGDGVNDAPALEAADVGVAMGLRGTDVAREAADLVLLDDRFASIVEGVAQGRRIFGNLRAALGYIIAVHVPLAGLALLPVMLGLPQVLFPMQVVVLELVIDPMCSIVFEGRRADRWSMLRPPRALGEPLFGAAHIATAALQGAAMLAVLFGLHWSLTRAGLDGDVARAATLIGVVSANLGLAGVAVATRGGEGAETYAAMVAAAAAGLAASLYAPWLARLFLFAPPEPAVIALAVAAGAGSGALAGLAGLWATRPPAVPASNR